MLLTSHPIVHSAVPPRRLSITLLKQSTRQRLGSSGVWMARASEWQSLTGASRPLGISTGGFRRIRSTVHAASIATTSFPVQRILTANTATETELPETFL